jgi:uncharacterized alkaline shock family protein YloU
MRESLEVFMIGYFDTDLGRIQIAPTIVRRIILSEIEGNNCFRVNGAKPGEPIPRKIAEKSIRVSFEEGVLETTLLVSVLYGARIIKEARDLQGNIIRAMQFRAGLKVKKVEINVEDVFLSDDVVQPLLLDQGKEMPEPANPIVE